MSFGRVPRPEPGDRVPAALSEAMVRYGGGGDPVHRGRGTEVREERGGVLYRPVTLLAVVSLERQRKARKQSSPSL